MLNRISGEIVKSPLTANHPHVRVTLCTDAVIVRLFVLHVGSSRSIRGRVKVQRWRGFFAVG